jgi:hypothetical protein
MKPYIAWMMYLVIVVYNFLDWYHTKMAFAVGIGEANPFMSSMGIYQILFVKIVFVGMFGVLLTTRHSRIGGGNI